MNFYIFCSISGEMPSSFTALYVQNAQRNSVQNAILHCEQEEYVVKFQKEVRNMKDIPMFTTEYGVASLSLSQIPYRREAYIRIRSVQPGKLAELLKECVGFCRAVGAELVYAADCDELERYLLKAAVIEMQGDAIVDWEKVEHIFQVTEQTVAHWREICNNRMAGVDCATTLSAGDEKRILASGGAYFVHHNGELLGTGWMEEDKLLLICGTKPGAGKRVLHTMLSLNEGGRVRLEVASTNDRAIRLYENNGFIRTGELIRWYLVFDQHGKNVQID